MVNKNNNHSDEANYEEKQNRNQEYDIEYNVDDSMHDEQQKSLLLDKHDDTKFHEAGFKSGTDSHSNRSFIKREQKNNINKDQERSGGQGFAEAPPPGDSGEDFSSSDNNGGDPHHPNKNRNNDNGKQNNSTSFNVLEAGQVAAFNILKALLETFKLSQGCTTTMGRKETNSTELTQENMTYL